MTSLLANRHKKKIGFFILTLFYCDFILAAYVPMRNRAEHNAYGYQYNSHCYATQELNSNNDAGQLYNTINTTNEHPQEQTGMFNGEAADVAERFEDDGGPSQPEMESFQPVGANNMVDLFTGDFSYNIPLLDVGGYPINIFYNGGISMDQEASWVGLGWNINPGTITRNLRGLPDDFSGAADKITKTASIKENKTTGVSVGADLEIFGRPSPFTANLGIFHNNYRGWGLEAGLNASINAGSWAGGALSAGLSLGLNSNTQEGLTVTPGASISLSFASEEKKAVEPLYGSGSISTALSYNTRAGLKNLQVSGGVTLHDVKELTKKTKLGNVVYEKKVGISNTLFSSGISFAAKSYTPTISMPYTSRQASFTGKVGGELWGLDGNFYVSGYVTSSKIAPEDLTQVMPAYGYLNYQQAKDNQSALLDFNREKDIPYREKPVVPNIGIPSYTYDIFSINGQGTGGSFRAYRGDIGYMHDHYMSTKSGSDAFSVDVGAGGYFHGGIDFNDNSSITQSGPWVEQNALRNSIGFKQSDSIFEAAYFRNPGEKAIISKGYYESLGGDDVVTPEIYQSSPSSSYILATSKLRRYRNALQAGTTTLTPNTYRTKRDKRVETITYLTADEASKVGFLRYIENYTLNAWDLKANCNKDFDNSLPFKKLNDALYIERRYNDTRKPNHISEIAVLNPDGKRYVYGIPVYQIKQKDITAAVNKDSSDLAEGLVQYNDAASNPIQHPDTRGSEGRDDYYSKEEVPAYAHSFLLSAIVSPEYSDITGDGISDDDLGDVVKFNYSRVAGNLLVSEKNYGWRAPYADGKASYNEGLKTEIKDDRASYIYGEKELWYMHSIESKNMIVTFKLENRKDALEITENGQKDTLVNPAKLLREINLYTKADFIKNGTNARPIKTVHFLYSYKLCQGIYKSIANPTYNYGKLTLDTIYFTYNGNSKRQNIYSFFYTGKNPGYNSKSFDRWGMYKDPAQNPGATGNKPTNDEFPYALQDSAAAAQNAAAWTLDSIILPSKAKIKITYESDDYAYVQNKRAAQIFKIAGFATQQPDGNTVPVASLYADKNNSSLYVFAQVNEQVTTSQEVYDKYLQGIEKIFFKLFVQYPKGYEYVPCYADIDLTGGGGVAYGVSANPSVVWLKVKGIDIKKGTIGGSFSPLAKAAIQFLRINLPAQAYPGSEVGDNVSIQEAVQMAGAMIGNIAGAFTLYDYTAMEKNRAKYIDTSKSLIRLNNPVYKKYGGGLRVKTVKIYDAWDEMTQQRKSTYGQNYFYTTLKQVNGVSKEISSGVASYEPSVGAEENPWKQPVEFIERVAALAPANLAYTETPFGESFFPAPMVGYSEVKVQSIHTDTVKSATGYEQTKFFTTYDFPTLTDNTTLLDNKKRFAPGLGNLLKINARHYISISQGFKVELNDMNGKMKSQATYPANDSTAAIAYTENFYKIETPNAEFKKLANTVMAVSSDGVIDTAAMIGKDVELMFDMRQQQTLINGNNYNVNTDVIPAIFGIPFPIPSFWYFPQREEDLYRSVAVTKVIQRYGILDSVVAIDKGSKISTKNLLYDSETGEVLLTRTQNEFNDPIYNFTYPAHWAYSGMGPAYKNVHAIFNSVGGNISFNNGFLEGNSKYPGMINYFESGDEIMATGKIKTGEEDQTDCSGNTLACPVNTYASEDSTITIWAVDSRKVDPASTAGMLFVDREGNPYSATNVSLKILRSGRRNMSMSPVATVTCLANPLQVVSSKLELVLNNSKNVVATGAVAYKDFWKTSDINFIKDTTIASPQQFTVSLLPSVTIKEFVHSNESADNPQDRDGIAGTHAGATYIGASYNYGGLDDGDIFGSCHTKELKNKSILQFNFSSIPQSATVNSASFSLTPKVPNSTFSSTYLTGAGDDDCHSFNWNNATQFNGGVSNVSLKRIISSWTSSSNYADISTTDLNKVAITQSAYTNINCKLLMQDVISSTDRSSGLLFVLDNETHPNDNDDQLNYLTFCAGSGCSSVLNLTYTASIGQTYQLCRSAITQRNINPYITGILGNWRSDRSYVFQGERQQSDPNVVTNIRKDGAIKDYAPYWSFFGNGVIATTDTTQWVWNSQITLFNKKGFELENKDPLGRYNAGSYGYNQSLPVSVTQNSKYREQFYDGFEDYRYDNNSCPDACPIPRPVDFTMGNAVRDTANIHSGRYSLRVAGNDSALVNINVISGNADPVPLLTADIETITFDDINVTPNGNGTITETGTVSGFPNQWKFYFQPRESGTYKVQASPVCTGTVRPPDEDASVNMGISGAPYNPSDQSYELTAGRLYQVTMSCNLDRYSPGPKPAPKIAGPCDLDNFTGIPLTGIYDYNDPSDSLNTVTVIEKNCSEFTGIETDSSVLNQSFTPTKGNEYWFSTWVKEEQQCLTGSYTNNHVYFDFFDAGNNKIGGDIAAPSGNIIEGWQRYDRVLGIPANAVRMSVKLRNEGSGRVYFDDLRIHPNKANMQSFVYDPVTLRLMAQLDENNYASFYEYDDDGTLIRVKKETIRGIQTIKETRSYLVE